MGIYFERSTQSPGRKRIPFCRSARQHLRDIELKINTSDTLFGFRLDTSGGPGEVRIADLKLIDNAGNVLISWP